MRLRLPILATRAGFDMARALRVLGWLAPMPLVVSRAIARHVLEAVAAERPTLLIDDNDGARSIGAICARRSRPGRFAIGSSSTRGRSAMVPAAGRASS